MPRCTAPSIVRNCYCLVVRFGQSFFCASPWLLMAAALQIVFHKRNRKITLPNTTKLDFKLLRLPDSVTNMVYLSVEALL